MARFEHAIPTVKKHEGGFVNHPADPGGATNFGISLRFLNQLGDADGDGWLDGDLDHDGDVDIQDIRMMTWEEAEAIYKSQWWDRYNYGRIEDQRTATVLMDFAVNMGHGRATRLLQQALCQLGTRVDTDGKLGNNTFDTINRYHNDSDRLVKAFQDQAADFYRSLNKPQFINGWLNRAYDA